MKHAVPFRIIVTEPLPGVRMQVQKGRDELLAPSSKSGPSLVFDFDMTVDVTDSSLNFLGKFAQGPKNTRFVYVNSGTYAGQPDTCWARRAKLSLMSITKQQIDDLLTDPLTRLEIIMPGVGSDGGPTCASVKGIEWRVVRG